MPGKSFPHSAPVAASRARSRNSLRSVSVRAFALLLIALLVIPSNLAIIKVEAGPTNVSLSAPPEPFLVYTGSSASGFLLTGASLFEEISATEGIDFAKLEKGQRDEDMAAGNKKPNDSALFEAPLNSWLQKYCGGDPTQWNNYAKRYK